MKRSKLMPKSKKSRKYIKPEDVIGFIENDGMRHFFSKNVLTNQLKLESPAVSRTFDKLCKKEMDDISEQFSYVTMYLHGMNLEDEKSDVEKACSIMLMNAATSYLAAFSLLRNGFRLQPGIVLRNLIEALSMILHIFLNPSDLSQYEKGNLKSTKTLAEAKKVIPHLGRIYGYFSEGFTHIGSLYKGSHPLIPYEAKDEEALMINISFLKLSIWLLYVVTELICFTKVTSPRYWKIPGTDPRMLQFAPSIDELEWMDTFLEYEKWEKY